MQPHSTPWFFLLLEIIFFSGVAGCILVVTISWISIFSDGFSRDHEPAAPAEGPKASKLVYSDRLT